MPVCNAGYISNSARDLAELEGRAADAADGTNSLDCRHQYNVDIRLYNIYIITMDVAWIFLKYSDILVIVSIYAWRSAMHCMTICGIETRLCYGMDLFSRVIIYRCNICKQIPWIQQYINTFVTQSRTIHSYCVTNCILKM